MPGAVFNHSEGLIEANFENVVLTVMLTPSPYAETLPTSISVEQEWIVFDFISIVSEAPGEEKLEPIEEFILSGGNTDYKIWMENQDFLHVGIRHRLSARAALTFPDLTQETVLDMLVHAEELSIWLQGQLPDAIPPSVLNTFKDY